MLPGAPSFASFAKGGKQFMVPTSISSSLLNKKKQGRGKTEAINFLSEYR